MYFCNLENDQELLADMLAGISISVVAIAA